MGSLQALEGTIMSLQSLLFCRLNSPSSSSLSSWCSIPLIISRRHLWLFFCLKSEELLSYQGWDSCVHRKSGNTVSLSKASHLAKASCSKRVRIADAQHHTAQHLRHFNKVCFNQRSGSTHRQKHTKWKCWIENLSRSLFSPQAWSCS